jgi:hypothetical protein
MICGNINSHFAFCIKAILFISDFGCLFPFGTYLQIVMTIWDAVLAKNNF